MICSTHNFSIFLSYIQSNSLSSISLLQHAEKYRQFIDQNQLPPTKFFADLAQQQSPLPSTTASPAKRHAVSIAQSPASAAHLYVEEEEAPEELGATLAAALPGLLPNPAMKHYFVRRQLRLAGTFFLF